jgi:hypothetical protein
VTAIGVAVGVGVAVGPGFGAHPGNAAASRKLATSSKAVSWDAVTTTPPLGGKGPFEPAQMRFSFTLVETVALSPLPAHASFEAGTEAFDAGELRHTHELRGYQRITPSGVGVGFTFGAG